MSHYIFVTDLVKSCAKQTKLTMRKNGKKFIVPKLSIFWIMLRIHGNIYRYHLSNLYHPKIMRK